MDNLDRQVHLACLDYATLGIRPTVALLHAEGLASRARLGQAMQRLEARGLLLRERWQEADGETWTWDVCVAETSGLEASC